MPRIPLRSDRELGPLTRVLARISRRWYGQVPEPLRAIAHPRLLWTNGVHELMAERAAKRLPAELREIVVHRVATVVGCSWCVDFGTMLTLKAGFSVQRHRELAHYDTSDAFTAEEKLALAYADAMTAQPMTVDDDLVERVRAALGDDGLVELTYFVALENFRARTNHALGITARLHPRRRLSPPVRRPDHGRAVSTLVSLAGLTTS